MHTDCESFTLLVSTTHYLEVMSDAGLWISTPVSSGRLAVNVWAVVESLNAKCIAASHRVQKVSEQRYFFLLFFTCEYDSVIQPDIAVKSNEQHDLYPSVRCGDHLYAQTIQAFWYLQKRLETDARAFYDSSLGIYSFGRQVVTPSSNTCC